jgi:predicted amidophosphoribosyltransferase
LAYGQRQRNVRNAFQCPAPLSVTDQHILLVDDVLTTGATADACAHVLLKAGARAVDVLTVARVLPGNASHNDSKLPL